MIKRVIVQPNTQGAERFSVGKKIDFRRDERITKIDFLYNEYGVTELEIFVDDELYATYVNVPCALFYKKED